MDSKSIVGRVEIQLIAAMDDNFNSFFIIKKKEYKQTMFNKIKVCCTNVCKLNRPRNITDEQYEALWNKGRELAKMYAEMYDAVHVKEDMEY